MLINPFELTKELVESTPEKKSQKTAESDPFGLDQKGSLDDFLSTAGAAGAPTEQKRAASFLNRIVDTRKLDDDSPSL